MKAIMYHYVRRDDSAWPFFKHLRVEDFRRQLDYFAREYRACSREDLACSLQTGEPLKNGVVLTFDDGFKDHYEFVFPELKSRGLLGIFYVPAYPYVTGRMLDVHRVHALIGRFGGKVIWEALIENVSDDMLSDRHVREFREQAYRKHVHDNFTKSVKRTLNYFIDYKFRRKILDGLMAQFFNGEETLARKFYLTVEEIKEIAEGGMIIGSHSVNHPCMSKLTATDQKREIEDSFQWLNSIIGPQEPKTFCYPYGGFHSFTEETERLLEAAGCDFSFNVEHRDIERRDLESRRQALPRYDCNLFPHGGGLLKP